MNSETLFSMALGLHPPWQVKDVTFSTDELARSELHLHIDFAPGSRFLDDANNLCPVHDTVKRQWQHLSFFEHTCYLHCAVPRIITADGKVRTVDVPWARPGSGFTALCGIEWVKYTRALRLGSGEPSHRSPFVLLSILQALRDRSRVVPRSDRACVFTEHSVVKMQALRNRVESLRSNVSTPCWVETSVAGRLGRRRHQRSRNFCRLLGRDAHKSYRKNSDSPLLEGDMLTFNRFIYYSGIV